MIRTATALSAIFIMLPVAARAAPDAPRPLSIEEALRLAEPASKALAAARAQVAHADEQITSAKSARLPQVNASSSYTLTIRSEFDNISFGSLSSLVSGPVCNPNTDPNCDFTVDPRVTPPCDIATDPGCLTFAPIPPTTSSGSSLPFGQRNTWRIGVDVVQPLYDGGRAHASIALARAGAESSRLDLASARTQVVLQVAQAYYDAALAQRQVEIAQVTLDQAQQTLDETQLDKKHGAVPEFDVVRSEVARDNQKTAVIQFEAQRDQAFVHLRQLVGLPLDQALVLSSPLDVENGDALDAAARAAAGVGPGDRRLASVKAETAVHMGEESLRLAHADRLPQVAASTDFGLVDYAAHPFNTDWRTNWTAGVSVSFPVFDGFRRRAAEASARADIAAARARLELVEQQADVEVRDSDASITAATATWEASARTVDLAKRAYDIAELRFNQGASTHLELVDARLQLEQAELNHARSARDVRVARVRRALLAGLPLGTTAAGF